MISEPTTAEKIRKLPWSYLASAANTVFTQFTFFGTVFVLFLDELGLSKTGIGFLLSLFPFFGLTALFTAQAVARFGFKRTYLTFWTARKFITLGLLLTPWVVARFGAPAASLYVGVVVAGFAVCRAIGETGNYPWIQEYVPRSLRGKFSATENVTVTVTSLLAVSAAGFVLAQASGLTGFMALIAVGVVFGFLSIWASSHLPGGAPAPAGHTRQPTYRRLLQTARDRDFRLYLLGAGLISVGTGALASFLPLFMQEEVGLNSSQVVWLQTASLFGSLLSSFAWGWAADRYGSKPVMLSGVILIAIRPVFWMLMPRETPVSFYIAFGVAFVASLVGMAWGIGSTRQLFVGLVPPEKKTEYMALHYAFMGAVGGLSQLAAGRLLDLTGGISGQFFFIPLDPYTVLFVGGIVLPTVAGLLLGRLRTDSRVSVGEFAGMFLQGNPLLAAESLIRHGFARDEEAAVTVTERLGQARSPLTVDELLEALADPRFNVRFEAIIAMARMPAEPRLISALGELLTGPEPALAVIAAWALGRMGDERAIPSVRQGLTSRYRSVQAHSARALGTIGDRESAARLLQHFDEETDEGLCMAYASALGKLGVAEAVQPLLAFLYTRPNLNARLELALALARLAGDEHHFIQLWRASRAETGTAFSQAVTALKRRTARLAGVDGALITLLDECADAFARENLDRGAELLQQAVPQIPLNGAGPAPGLILAECTARLAEFKANRIEYVLLALHTLRETEAAVSH